MAYAALLSLAQILHQTLHRDYQYLILDEKKQIESLVEEVTFLQNCLPSQKITQDMETKIRDAAFIAEDIIESVIRYRFLIESAGHEDRSKERRLIRFDVIESWIVNSSKFDPSILSTLKGFEASELEIAGVGGIEVPGFINGIRHLAKTRRFKAWFLDPSCILHDGGKPHPDAIWALGRLATYDTKMVIISNSPLLASTIMEELRIQGFDTSLFVGAITSEDLRREDAWLEELGPSFPYRTMNYQCMFNDQGYIFPEMYKSAMVMAGVDAADCIAVGCRRHDIYCANAAGISSVFVIRSAYGRELDARSTYMLPSFTW